MSNQNPEQIARDQIDSALQRCGWAIQDKARINLQANIGVAVREFQTDIGPADYVLFVDGKPCGIIEAKREEEGHRLTFHESQSEDYSKAKLKHLDNKPLPFVYESTGEVTRFTDFNDPKPRSREVFTFHRPETFREWLKKDKTLRGRFSDLPVLPKDGLRDCQISAINNLETSFKENRPKALKRLRGNWLSQLQSSQICTAKQKHQMHQQKLVEIITAVKQPDIKTKTSNASTKIG